MLQHLWLFFSSLSLHCFCAYSYCALIFFLTHPPTPHPQVEDAQPLPLSDKMEQMFIEKLLWNYNDKTFYFFVMQTLIADKDICSMMCQ